jgi:Na+-exporting ATPase
MVVRAAWVPSQGTYFVGQTNEPFNPTVGPISYSALSPVNQTATSPPVVSTSAQLVQDAPTFQSLLNIASMCNLAVVEQDAEKEWKVRGDPTECAIQVFARRFDWGRPSLTEGTMPTWSESESSTSLLYETDNLDSQITLQSSPSTAMSSV